MKTIMGLATAVTAISVCAAELPLSDESARERAGAVLKKLSLEQKVSLCGGCATMCLNAIPEAGIPREWGMSDMSEDPFFNAKTIVIQPCLGQEAGNVLARTLFGDVNPSGKLCLAWPRKYADTPVAQCGTYNDAYVTCQERFYVGYRWYDAKSVKPLFPFGYGLSHTTFDYANASVEKDGEGWKVSVRVANSGRVAGKESVQFYMAPVAPKVERAVKELKGFAKTRLLQPGESEVLSATLARRDFAYWDVLTHGWRTDPGKYEVLAPPARTSAARSRSS